MPDILITTLFVSISIQLLFFIFAALLKTDLFTDLTYGTSFVLLALGVLLTNSPNMEKVIIASAITLWGVRLAGYLFSRIIKTKKDKRFDGIRENVIKFGAFWLLQAFSVWFISIPAILFLSKPDPSPSPILYVTGMLIWFVGLGIESIADHQKSQFKKDNRNKNSFIRSGLWKYSRHPNYFGEILLWWGIFFAVSSSIFSDYPFSILGPIFITFLLLFVSGIPPLEKRYNQKFKGNKAYESYKKRTSILIPLPPGLGS